MTDVARPLPPAGWYPDPEYAGCLRWWDGYQWTLRSPSPPPATTTAGRARRPVGKGFARLAAVLGVLLGLTMVVVVSRLFLYAWGFLMVGDATYRGDVGRLETFDLLDSGLSIATVLGVLLSGICWMVWQYLLARSSHPGELRRGPGMHAFSWIIPVVALWFPYQNVKDLWRVNARGARHFLGWWWAGWITTTVVNQFLQDLYENVGSVATFRVLVVVEFCWCAVALATAIMAVRLVRVLTAGGLERTDESPADPLIPEGRPAAW